MTPFPTHSSRSRGLVMHKPVADGGSPVPFGMGGGSWDGRQRPRSSPQDLTWLPWVLVAQAPAQSSVWGCFIWGQTHLISQAGPVLCPASGQRAAFISQLQGAAPRAVGQHGHGPRSSKRPHPWGRADNPCRMLQPCRLSDSSSGRAAHGAVPRGSVCAHAAMQMPGEADVGFREAHGDTR